MKKKLYILVNHHFDLTWRRRFRKPFISQGEKYASYTDIEGWYILDNLTWAEKYPEYKFNVESVAVLREFFRLHPEKKEQVKDLYRQGRLGIPGSGDNIVDVNLVSGESVARNFIAGQHWMRREFGRAPSYCTRQDGFGNSAQLPQILRGCGMKSVGGISYYPCKGKIWQGLDGSRVRTEAIPCVGGVCSWLKAAPCAACHGFGKVGEEVCSVCGGKGIKPFLPVETPRVEEIPEEAFGELGAYISVGSEEAADAENVPQWLAKARTRFDASFLTFQEIERMMRPLEEEMDGAPPQDINETADLNPANTGCYVSRIKNKQQARKLEYALRQAETMCALTLSAADYPKAELDALWEKLFFLMFHDNITGTVVDPAELDATETWEEMEEGLARIRRLLEEKAAKSAPGVWSFVNAGSDAVHGRVVCRAKGPARYRLEGKALTPLEQWEQDGQWHTLLDLGEFSPFSVKHVTEEPAESAPAPAALEKPEGECAIENQRYRIRADAEGLLEIYDKRYARVVSCKGEYRPGEWILEHDEGNPYATLSPEVSRVPQAGRTRLVGVEKTPGYQRLIYRFAGELTSYILESYDITYRVTLYQGGEEVDFSADVQWDDFNHRFRVAFPTPLTGRHMYEIPYGVIERKPYAPSYGWLCASGDYPALNWAGVETPDYSVALMNFGTPSYQVEPKKQGDVLLLSLLRSPSVPTVIHEPRAYSMREWDGMRDAGEHHFHYALRGYPAPFADTGVIADAHRFVCAPYALQGRMEPLSPPPLTLDNLRVTAVKRGETEPGLVVRMAEFRGKGGKFVVWGENAALETNLLEDEISAVEGRAVRPFEIVTLRFPGR